MARWPLGPPVAHPPSATTCTWPDGTSQRWASTHQKSRVGDMLCTGAALQRSSPKGEVGLDLLHHSVSGHGRDGIKWKPGDLGDLKRFEG